MSEDAQDTRRGLAEFRLLCDGVRVASVASMDREMALRDIRHYATLYAQEGAVEILEKINKKWRCLRAA